MGMSFFSTLLHSLPQYSLVPVLTLAAQGLGISSKGKYRRLETSREEERGDEEAGRNIQPTTGGWVVNPDHRGKILPTSCLGPCLKSTC